jgi:hypothetical protein
MSESLPIKEVFLWDNSTPLTIYSYGPKGKYFKSFKGRI